MTLACFKKGRDRGRKIKKMKCVVGCNTIGNVKRLVCAKRDEV